MRYCVAKTVLFLSEIDFFYTSEYNEEKPIKRRIA